MNIGLTFVYCIVSWREKQHLLNKEVVDLHMWVMSAHLKCELITGDKMNVSMNAGVPCSLSYWLSWVALGSISAHVSWGPSGARWSRRPWGTWRPSLTLITLCTNSKRNRELMESTTHKNCSIISFCFTFMPRCYLAVFLPPTSHSCVILISQYNA